MKHSRTLYISLAVFLAVGGVALAQNTGSETREANKIIGNGSPAVAAKTPDGSVLEAYKIIGNGSPAAAAEARDGSVPEANTIIGNGLETASGQ